MAAFRHSATLFVVATAALATIVSAQDVNNTGAWTTPADASSDDIALLIEATSDANSYSSTVDTIICIADVASVQKQVVAGMNYRFEVSGCDASPEELGECQDENCSAALYDVVVFSQPWNHTLQVSSITLLE